jgi:hypothetical protein
LEIERFFGEEKLCNSSAAICILLQCRIPPSFCKAYKFSAPSWSEDHCSLPTRKTKEQLTCQETAKPSKNNQKSHLAITMRSQIRAIKGLTIQDIKTRIKEKYLGRQRDWLGNTAKCMVKWWLLTWHSFHARKHREHASGPPFAFLPREGEC